MKCSNCSNDMIQSKAGWLCVECGHIEMLTDDDMAKAVAAIPAPPEVLASPAPAAVAVEPEAKPESENIPEPEQPAEPLAEPTAEPVAEAKVAPRPRAKRLQPHHNDHDNEAKAASKPAEHTAEPSVPVPLIDISSIVGDVPAPESTVIDIPPVESPEKVLQESIAEIEKTPEPETTPEPTPEVGSKSNPAAYVEPQTAPSSSPAVASVVPAAETPAPGTTPTPETPQLTPAPETPQLTPAPENPAPTSPEAPLPALAPTPDSVKPPLQPVTHPRPLSSKAVAIIAVVCATLLILGGAVAYAAVAKPAAMSWLTGSKPTPAPAPASTPTPTPVLAAEVTPTPAPAVPVNQNAQRIEAVAAYKAAYLATAQNGFFSVTAPAVAISAVEPSTGKAYVVTKTVPTVLGQIHYWPGGVCSGPAKTPGTTGTKFLALQVLLVGNPTPYCVEVR